MSSNSFTPAQSIRSMDLLAQSFDLFPIPEVQPPKPQEEGSFLLQHPQYVGDGKYDAVAMLMASDRGLIDVLTPERQDLATSLIATVLSEQDLRAIAGIN